MSSDENVDMRPEKYHYAEKPDRCTLNSAIRACIDEMGKVHHPNACSDDDRDDPKEYKMLIDVDEGQSNGCGLVAC